VVETGFTVSLQSVLAANQSCAPAMGNSQRTAIKEDRFADPWFAQYQTPTEGYITADGNTIRFPFRLHSEELMVYGTANAAKLWAEQVPGEVYEPVLVGGKAVISAWFNNWADSDSGGAYHETWYYTYVTQKGQKLSLPYDSPMSLLVSDPRALQFVLRVICGDNPVNPGAGQKGIFAGRSVWGYPKFPFPATIKFTLVEDKRWSIDATLQDKLCVKASVRLPEADEEGVQIVPVDVVTAPDAAIGGPRLGGVSLGHNGAHQTRYGTAVKCTQYCKAWDPETDSIEYGDHPHFAPINGWDFKPLLKVTSPDYKIVYFKNSNWITADETEKRIAEMEAKHRRGTPLGQC